MRLVRIALACAIMCAVCVVDYSALSDEVSANIPANYRLVYSQDFEGDDPLGDFQFTDPDKWQLARMDDNHALEFIGRGKYRPKVRSPFIIGLISDYMFGDFILEADLLQTGREYPHRDMCIFFGFNSPSKFYYVHIASRTDPHSHNIFIVNDAPRTKISTKTTKGINWGRNQWHKVRIERFISDGTIKVFFDDMDTPIMLAKDKTFQLGYIGFGSFDDSGMVDNIKIWAPKVVRKRATFFTKKQRAAK